MSWIGWPELPKKLQKKHDYFDDMQGKLNTTLKYIYHVIKPCYTLLYFLVYKYWIINKTNKTVGTGEKVLLLIPSGNQM